MKRVISFLCFFIFLLSMSHAQNLSRYEYWIDDDYAGRNIVESLSNEIALMVSTESLTDGVHYFNFRAYRSDGVWGNYYRYLFYVSSYSVDVGEYEYWIDNSTNKVTGKDSGPEYVFIIDISKLGIGKHTFNFRAKNQSDDWGETFSEEFEIKNGVQPILPSLTISSNGNGAVTYNGTSVRNQSSSFSVGEESDAVISFVPDDGYRIKSVKVNSTDVTSNVTNNTYTISSIRENTTVEVEFEAIPVKSYTLKYVVDGETYKTYEINEGAAITPEPNPQKDGYTFSGWSDIPATMPARDVTVTGTFTKNEPVTKYYTLTIKSTGSGYASYNDNSVVNNTQSFSIKDGISAVVYFHPYDGSRIAKATMNGREISDLSSMSFTIDIMDEDVTIEVEFEAIPVKTYTLKYVVDGETYKTYEYKEGDVITPEAEPTKEGYTFSGWSDIPATMPARDVTITGTFTKNEPETKYFTLTVKATGSGYASYNDNSVVNNTQTFSIEEGTSVVVSFHPNDGYQIRSATVNGREIADISNMSFTIDIMDEDVTIEVEFGTLNVDGIFYSIDTDQKTAMVIKDPLLEKGGKYEGNIIIPETISYNGIEYSVIGIYDDAFAGCDDILTVSLPQSLTYIGIDAFWDCKNLVTVNIPSSIKRIFSLTFSGCNSLTNLYCYSEDVPQIADDAFYHTPIESVTLYVPESAIEKYKAAKPWSDFNKIVAIGSTPDDDSQFSGKCGENAYYKFEKAIHTLTISGEGAISGCNLLEDPDDRPWKSYLNDIQHINIESGITSLDYWAFYGCGCMTISIPKSVTTIRMVTFGNLDNLTDVYCYAENVPNTHESAFNGTHTESVTLHVPANAVKAYKTTLPWSEFKEIVAIETEPVFYEQFQVDGINYQVTESGEVEVISAEEGVKCVTIPSTVTHNSTLFKVTAITNDAFEKCEQMAAVIWNPSVMFNARVSNPNLLLYVKDKDFASIGVKNVIVNGTAESIELTDAASGNDFYCPKAFTAKKITYSHYYNMKTGLGESKGWETIVLPFDVQKYTSPKGEIIPFAKWTKSGSTKPFWLCELTASGYQEVDGIKANTPYIISMPNHEQYLSDYVITGLVTFSAEDVEVKASDDMQSARYQDRTFVPNYTNQRNDNYLALNVNNYYVNNTSTFTPDGSKFVKGFRSVHPFEAYITSTSNTRVIDVMDGMTTAIRSIMIEAEGTEVIKVYDTRGILVKTAKANDDLKMGLKAGVYIVNGKKMIIK